MKNIDQQLRFNMKISRKTISFSNVEITVVNPQNIKEKYLQNIVTILTFLIELKSINSFLIEITIIRLNF